MVLAGREGLAQRSVERRGRQRDAAALHQELVDGEHLLVIEVLRRQHQQQVRIRRHPAVLEIGVLEARVLGERIGELGILLGLGPGSRRLDHRDRLQEPRRQALYRGIERAFERLPVELGGQRNLRRLAVVIQHHVEPEGLGIEQARHLRHEAVGLLQLLRQRAAVRVGILETAP